MARPLRDLFVQGLRAGSSFGFFTKCYGSAGMILWLFGDMNVWRFEAQVLRTANDQEVMGFRRSMQDESSIVAVAGTILAQIAITALSLENLSRTHWTARAFFTFSLSASLMAVYYATRQYRNLGLCARPDQVKSWIRTKPNSSVMMVSDILNWGTIREDLPSVASVLTISAPNTLLGSSLNSFLIGFGVYLGLTWKKNLDTVAGSDDSRAVFIGYIVGLVFCFTVYRLSDAAIADQNYISESDFLQDPDQLPTSKGKGPANKVTQNNSSAAGPVPMSSVDVPNLASAHPSPAQRSGDSGSIFHNDSVRGELLAAFSEAAKSRRELARLDERIAELLEGLK